MLWIYMTTSWQELVSELAKLEPVPRTVALV